MRLHLSKGLLDEAIRINESSECYDGMAVRTHLYTVEEMSNLFVNAGCRIHEIASTPTFTDTIDRDLYKKKDKWEKLKKKK